MYICNATTQTWMPNFRVPEMKRVHVARIFSGQQVEVGRDWNSVQLQSVIEQLERFGAKNIKDVKHAHKFSGLLYSLDKPVKVDLIEEGHSDMVEEQSKRSVQELTKSALGFDAALRDKKTRRRTAKATTLEITEDLPPRSKPSGREVKFGVTVADDGHDSVDLD